MPKESKRSGVATLKARVVKPLDGDWSALGALLRGLQMPLHRALNNAITRVELAVRGGSKTHPRTLCYQYLRDAWEAEREAARERVEKKKKRAHPNDVEIVAAKPHSAVILGAANAMYTLWARWNQGRWKGDMTLPTFAGHSPIYVPGSAVEVRPVDGEAVVALRLTVGGATRLVVSVDGGSAHANLRRILSDPSCTGDARVVRGKRKKGWELRLAFQLADRERPAGNRVMVIHRGIMAFLTTAVARSEHGARDAYTAILEDGVDIVRHKQGYDARRRSLGHQRKQIGAGAQGHGRNRRMQHVRLLQDAEQRYVDAKCKEAAAHAIRLATRFGVTRILVEDWRSLSDAPFSSFVRRWPWAKLLSCIEWCAKRHGIEVQSRKTDANSKTCPVCGASGSVTGRMFLCSRCRLERDRDVVFAWNMLVREGLDVPHEEAKIAAKKIAARIRKK